MYAAMRLIEPLPLVYGYGWPSSLLLMAGLMAISITAGALSWHWSEEPFLRLKSHFSHPRPAFRAGQHPTTPFLDPRTPDVLAPGEARSVTAP